MIFISRFLLPALIQAIKCLKLEGGDELVMHTGESVKSFVGIFGVYPPYTASQQAFRSFSPHFTCLGRV